MTGGYILIRLWYCHNCGTGHTLEIEESCRICNHQTCIQCETEEQWVRRDKSGRIGSGSEAYSDLAFSRSSSSLPGAGAGNTSSSYRHPNTQSLTGSDGSDNSGWDGSSDDIELHELASYITEENHLVPSDTIRKFADSVFISYQEWRQAQSGTSQSASDSATYDNNEATRQSRSQGDSRKRQRPEKGQDSRGEDSNNVDTVPKPKASGETGTTVCLPFWKLDSREWRGCFAYKLTRIRDVKQHLNRVHAECCYCVRCGEDFRSEEELDAHYATTPSCTSRPFKKKWLSGPQKDNLRSWSNAQHSGEEQWYAIWDIMLPGIPRPDSPYLDKELSEEVNSFRDFLVTQGPGIMRETGEQEGIQLTTIEERVIPLALNRIFEQWATSRGQSSVRIPNSSNGIAGRAHSVWGVGAIEHDQEAGDDDAAEPQTAPEPPSNFEIPELAINGELPEIDFDALFEFWESDEPPAVPETEETS